MVYAPGTASSECIKSMSRLLARLRAIVPTVAVVVVTVIVASIGMFQLLPLSITSSNLLGWFIVGPVFAGTIASVIAYSILFHRLISTHGAYMSTQIHPELIEDQSAAVVTEEIAIMLSVLRQIGLYDNDEPIEPSIRRLAGLLEIASTNRDILLSKCQRLILYDILFPPAVRQEYRETKQARIRLYTTWLIFPTIRALGATDAADSLKMLNNYAETVQNKDASEAARAAVVQIRSRIG